MIIDYVDFTHIDTPFTRRRELDVGDVFINQGQCKACGWVIRSKNRHDYVTCRCGESTIDGGSWYVKYSGPLELHTVYYNDIEEK